MPPSFFFLLASEDVVRLAVGVPSTRAEATTSARRDGRRLLLLLLLLLRLLLLLLRTVLLLLLLVGVLLEGGALVLVLLALPVGAVRRAVAHCPVVVGVVVVDATTAVATLGLICLPGQLGLPHQLLHRVAAAALAVEATLPDAGAVPQHVALILSEVGIIGVAVAGHGGLSQLRVCRGVQRGGGVWYEQGETK